MIRKSSEILDTIRARISEMDITEQATSQVQVAEPDAKAVDKLGETPVKPTDDGQNPSESPNEA